MFSIIMINTCADCRFTGITLLAGLQTVPPETLRSGDDRRRQRLATLPLCHIAVVEPDHPDRDAVLDHLHLRRFQLVYALTHGGPQNATQLFATYAFDIGLGAGQLGLGASIALAMLPALALLIVGLTLYMRRQ